MSLLVFPFPRLMKIFHYRPQQNAVSDLDHYSIFAFESLLILRFDLAGGPASVDEKDMACDHIGSF